MVMVEFKFPSEPTLADMARVVILWSALELRVNIGIASTLYIPYEKLLLSINSIRNFRTRLEILRNLVDYEFRRGPKKLEEISKLFVKINDHYDLRNLIAHYHWYAIEAENPSSPLFNVRLSHTAYSLAYKRDKKSKKMEPKSLKITPEKLKSEIAEIPKTIEETRKLVNEYLFREAKRHAYSRKRQLPKP